ncbi:Major allergen Asp f 2 [Fulvia fulva]|uniref:Major allergen Asp f 2 n=1 Tax=Passalora fulva TaxID=5499 RepID=A0A9Q8P2I5_PASFU|nr:Major allergen Asp f 2 [Fulvia fulva]KAK4635949.1 Major allergen Asp f 2 [Fulvia fulva]KAK4638000.1 Major allergen Asp f 2 [Fulvia fulva]UJO10771.1 Major allergen Asp f 2 [Fulvia fulva]WPV10081.1 Major allergen Asp f 2 [Fulvia fulva]WPV24548.1 Major allergen Asp f 2 [Fulvia fulva]
MRSVSAVLLTALTAVSAAPIEERQAPFEVTMQAAWNAGATPEWRIHSSCNASQRYQLEQGLNEAVMLAEHGRQHINRWGNNSEIYQKYFGNRPTFEAIGALDIIVNGDRAGALFRCDDPDQNCANMPTWGGHWRGSNATGETVICPTSFFERRPLATLCAWGYNVREYSRSLFWGSDLLHRLYHIPAFGQGYIDHYSEGYEAIVESASMNSPNATHDSDGLQYFALEAYAYDVILPGQGCPGPTGELPSTSSAAAAPASTSSATLTATATAAGVSATSAMATATASAAAQDSGSDSGSVPENCHTHANGDVHCT